MSPPVQAARHAQPAVQAILAEDAGKVATLYSAVTEKEVTIS
jgi:hypothetical protein